MANFVYKALDQRGVSATGEIEGESKAAAAAALRSRGLTVLDLNETKKGLQMELTFMTRIKPKDLTVFSRQFATMVNSGLSMLRCLYVLEEQTENKKLAGVIGMLKSDVEAGISLSDALEKHPAVFSKLYVSMVRAGEASGAMEIVLVRLSEFMEKAARIAGKVKSAMMYPLSVLCIAGSITACLMIFIVPKFAKMFDEMLPGEPLPTITLVVVNASNMMANHALVVAAGLAVFVVIFKMLLKTKPGAYAFDWVALKCPPFSALVVRSVSARFCRTLGTLMASGVAVLQALQIVKDTAGNELVSRAIQDVHDAVKEGEGMTKPLEKSKVFPLMLCSMVEVGEETGALPDMLNRVAGVYEEEVDRAVEGLTSMIEPLMIVFLAVVVGGIVIALFAPMIKMIDKLGG